MEVAKYSGLGCLAIVAMMLIAFAFGWFNAILNVAGPENVKEQFAVAYGDYNALQATARNVCSYEVSLSHARTDEERQQRESQLQGQRTNYARIEAEYDAAYENAFKAKHVGPRDLPRTAPTLDEALQQTGCHNPSASP